ncbi:hypothetical protein [Paludibacterium yongneupense]|nr:hypothetical protein [Paludibacterium yongneupense]
MQRLSRLLSRLAVRLSHAWWMGMTRHARESLRDEVAAMESWRDRRR